jgi:hypothetical protein
MKSNIVFLMITSVLCSPMTLATEIHSASTVATCQSVAADQRASFDRLIVGPIDFSLRKINPSNPPQTARVYGGSNVASDLYSYEVTMSSSTEYTTILTRVPGKEIGGGTSLPDLIPIISSIRDHGNTRFRASAQIRHEKANLNCTAVPDLLDQGDETFVDNRAPAIYPLYASIEATCDIVNKEVDPKIALPFLYHAKCEQQKMKLTEFGSQSLSTLDPNSSIKGLLKIFTGVEPTFRASDKISWQSHIVGGSPKATKLFERAFVHKKKIKIYYDVQAWEHPVPYLKKLEVLE